MSQCKFFNKVKITDTKDAKITSISMSKNNIIIGDINGGVRTYEITSKNKLDQKGEIIFKTKTEQILLLKNKNICFILTSGELLAADFPSLNNKTQLIKSGIEKIFLNQYNKESKNQIMTISKKKRIKIYDIDNSNNQISLQDSKFKEFNIFKYFKNFLDRFNHRKIHPCRVPGNPSNYKFRK